MTAALAGGEITLPCTVEGCDKTITGAASGKGSASWKLGLHLRQAHNIAGTSKRRAKRAPGEPTDADLTGESGAAPILASISSIAAAVGDNKRVPSADDLSNGIGRGLALTTIFGASWFVDSDETIPEGPAGDAARSALIDNLSLSERAAKDLAKPFGRALAPTKINAKYGRAFVDNVDVVGSLSEIALIAMHWRQAARDRTWRRQQLLAQMQGYAAGPRAVPDMPDLSTFAPAPVLIPDVPAGHTTPPPTEGRVMSQADVIAARAQKGNN